MYQFLSTPSARRATGASAPASCRRDNFYPRPPRGGRLNRWPKYTEQNKFLSTPSARRATVVLRSVLLVKRFLSTPSARRATLASMQSSSISIFLSTPSARRATLTLFTCSHKTVISIHALREEGDPLLACCLVVCVQFLSTPSARRATAARFANVALNMVFLSTPSARRATSRADHPLRPA